MSNVMHLIVWLVWLSYVRLIKSISTLADKGRG